MEDREQIHEFAVKWIAKFRNQHIDYIELSDHYLGDDCAALGFALDNGYAFARAYRQAVSDSDVLIKVIDYVIDIPLLGSAIYSRWRHFNHWIDDPAEILKPENRAWFIVALSRLAILTAEKSIPFEGVPQEVRIISNCLEYGPCPSQTEIVEQRITLNAAGQVWFSDYAYGDGSGKYEKVQDKQYKIETALASNVLNKLAICFDDEYEEVYRTDIGNWSLELTNAEGKTYPYKGSLWSDFKVEGVALSDLIREALNLPDLYVFDGNSDMINRVVIDYHRQNKVKPSKVSEGATGEFIILDYMEQLILDRKTQTLEYIQHIGEMCKVSHKYEVEDGMDSLLGSFGANYLFKNIAGNPKNVVEKPHEFKNYRITVDYKKRPQKTITGSFDKKGLPDDFKHFATKVFNFINFYSMGEILDSDVYEKVRRLANQYIFCSVIFENSRKTYYYLTEDDSIEVDDFVVVPAGADNEEKIVKVVKVEYFSEENLPFSLDKAKSIIRRCTESDIM